MYHSYSKKNMSGETYIIKFKQNAKYFKLVAQSELKMVPVREL